MSSFCEVEKGDLHLERPMVTHCRASTSRYGTAVACRPSALVLAGTAGAEDDCSLLSIPSSSAYLLSLVGSCTTPFVTRTGVSLCKPLYQSLSLLPSPVWVLSVSWFDARQAGLDAWFAQFLLLHGVPCASSHDLSLLCGHLLPAEMVPCAHQCQDRQDRAGVLGWSMCLIKHSPTSGIRVTIT